MISGIYVIANLATGQAYVGSSRDITERVRVHKARLSRGAHENGYLQNAWEKYGPGLFSFKVLEECLVEHLQNREQFYVDLYGSMNRGFGYNLRGPERKGDFAKETRLKMSISATKKFADPAARQKLRTVLLGRLLTPEQRVKMLERLRSPEVRARMSASHVGHNPSPETRAKLRLTSTGRRHTPESRAKISAAHLGRKTGPRTPEVQAKITAANRGKKRTPEQCAHMREIWEKPEVRARRVAAQKAAWQRPEVRTKRTGFKGKHHSPKSRLQMSVAHRGKVLTPTHRQKIGAAFRGKPWTPARREAQRAR